MLKDFLNLFFPDACVSCQCFLVTGEEYICTKCSASLVKVHSDPLFEEKNARKFWGKVKINNCYTFLKYNKGGVAQQILFAIKYNDQKELASVMGKRFGFDLKGRLNDEIIDMLVPVPLHRRKLRQRGFNQSLLIAEGMSFVTGIPCQADLIKRKKYGVSLTKNTRLDRWFSNQDTYCIGNENLCLEGKHLLIVDDVMTTGSTFEVIANILYKAGASKVSVAALAAAV